jgi:hypothetical protein
VVPKPGFEAAIFWRLSNNVMCNDRAVVAHFALTAILGDINLESLFTKPLDQSETTRQ